MLDSEDHGPVRRGEPRWDPGYMPSTAFIQQDFVNVFCEPTVDIWVRPSDLPDEREKPAQNLDVLESSPPAEHDASWLPQLRKRVARVRSGRWRASEVKMVMLPWVYCKRKKVGEQEKGQQLASTICILEAI